MSEGCGNCYEFAFCLGCNVFCRVVSFANCQKSWQKVQKDNKETPEHAVYVVPSDNAGFECVVFNAQNQRDSAIAYNMFMEKCAKTDKILARILPSVLIDIEFLENFAGKDESLPQIFPTMEQW